jgi:rhodanese-related sulfurtransferase
MRHLAALMKRKALSTIMKTTLKQIGMILLVSGFLALIANTVHPRRIPWIHDWSAHVESKARKAGVKVIPLSVALESKAQFIDVRATADFERGHIPDALSIPASELDQHFDQLLSLVSSDHELVIYCSNRECDDALVVAEELKRMGAEKLVIYIDGFDLWQRHGGAVER